MLMTILMVAVLAPYGVPVLREVKLLRNRVKLVREYLSNCYYMVRSRWKPSYAATTYVGYSHVRRSSKLQHAELGFCVRYFYYLVLDPSKFISYNIFSRSSTIFRYLVGSFIRVYRGSRWRTLFITRFHVGYKFGEFSKTRQRAVFRSKTLKKKTKSHKSVFLKNLRINRLRLLKSGKVRKHRISTLVSGIVY